ncbi:MAG: hypothetical protein JSS96_05545 [Bacteroidetes bacterium]|nr:hypothetical protein [Bacteroidota bacterium]
MMHRLSPRQEAGSKWLTATLLSIYIIVVLLLAIQHSDTDTKTNQTAKNTYGQNTIYNPQIGTEIHTQTAYKP